MKLSHNSTMIEHLNASQALKALRQRSGLSVRATAEALNAALSTYSSYERTFKRPYLPIELVTKLVHVFDGRGEPPITRKDVLALGVPQEDVDEVAELTENIIDQDAVITASIVEERLTKNAGYDRHRPFHFHPSDDFIPVRAIQRSEGQVYFNLLETQIGSRPRPPGIASDEEVFAFLAPDDRMGPRWKRGEPVFVHPFRPPVFGEHALIFINQDGRKQDEVYFAQFVVAYEEKIVIQFYTVNARNNGSIAMGFDLIDVKSMWRVFEWPELLA